MNLGFPIEIIEGVQVFDIELFVAYFEDWKERFDFACKLELVVTIVP
jgi:hypothetical protein